MSITTPAVPVAATQTSPKVILMGIVSLIAPAILVALEYVQNNGHTIFAQLPPVLLVVIGAAASGAATWVAGWLKADPLRGRADLLSPKVLAGAGASIIVTAILAGLQFLQTPDGQNVFHALPPILVAVVGALINSAATWLASYHTADGARHDTVGLPLLGAQAGAGGADDGPSDDENMLWVDPSEIQLASSENDLREPRA